MSDYSELKRLAEAAADESQHYLSRSLSITVLSNALGPAAVLALIAENERLESEAVYAAAGFDAAREEVDRLKAENEVFEEGIRSLASTLAAGGYNAETLTATQLVEKVQWGVNHLADASGRLADDLRAERDQLKAENEALRKDAERYRWLMSSAVMNGTLGIQDGWIDFEFKDEAQENIDAAMGKGEQS